MSEQQARLRRGGAAPARVGEDGLSTQGVGHFAADAAQVSSFHANGLADIRRASRLTQQQVAEVLGTDQGTVSKIEHRGDLLLSTLREYLTATGAVRPKIVAEKDGVEISLELNVFGPSSAQGRGR